jgi:GNAT superfamily N-acetyltransferase
MEQELVDKLEVADMPSELKLALKELAHEVDLLWPSLSAVQRRRTRRRLDRVVAEAIDPATDTHWWEIYLDLIAKMAGEGGTAGQPVVEAIQRLRPLLRSRLGPYDEVSLKPITEDTVWGICQLSDTLTEPRKNFVAPNAISLAQAHFNKHAWFRAIYAGKAPVGFMMIVDDDETPEYFLWRFMIAEPYQGRGYGRQAIQRLVEYVRTRPGARELLVSCGEGEGSPKAFYLKQGFVPTGEVMDEETVLRMVLA